MFNKDFCTEEDLAELENAREAEETTRAIDLIENGDEIIVAQGGRGGAGNRSSKVKVPKNRPAGHEASKGTPGEVVKVTLEMKMLADVGFVGYQVFGL